MTRLKDKVIDWAYFIVIPIALILVMFVSFAQFRSGFERDRQIASLNKQISENKELAEQIKTLTQNQKLSTDQIKTYINCVLDFLATPNRAGITLDDIPTCSFRREAFSSLQQGNGARSHTPQASAQSVPLVQLSSTKNNTPRQEKQLDNSQNPMQSDNIIERIQNALKGLPLIGELLN